MTYKVVIVLALLAPHVQACPEDSRVAGAYIVSFDATNVAEVDFANAALDAFHRRVPVSELDAFAFHVLDPRKGHQVLAESDADSYSYDGVADIDGPHIADWKVATFRVQAKGGSPGQGCDLGEVTVGGIHLREMADSAVVLLWGERRRAAGQTPFVVLVPEAQPELAPAEDTPIPHA